MTSNDATTAAGAITLMGAAGCLAALVALHIVPTGLSPRVNPVSQYGITRYRAGYRVQTVAMGVAAIAAAVGVAQLDLSGGALIVALLVAFGVARLAIGWFPMDAPGSRPTDAGRRHGLLALVAFGAATVAALRLGPALGRSHLWGSGRDAITAVGLVMLASLVGLGGVRRNKRARRWFGLIERVFYAGALAFLVLLAVELLRMG